MTLATETTDQLDTILADMRKLIVRHVTDNPDWYGSLTLTVKAKAGQLSASELDVHTVTCKRSNGPQR